MKHEIIPAFAEWHFRGILDLQDRNLKKSISLIESQKEGFVTVVHTIDIIRKMNHPFPHIIGIYDQNVIAYALVMTKAMRNEISVLIPLFKRIDQLSYHGSPLKDENYFVMGQICIAKAFRSSGIVKELYEGMKKQMTHHFRYIITEIAKSNERSLNAHYKNGFEILESYESDNIQWVIVINDLQLNVAQPIEM